MMVGSSNDQTQTRFTKRPRICDHQENKIINKALQFKIEMEHKHMYTETAFKSNQS